MSDREALERIANGRAWEDFCDQLKEALGRMLGVTE